MTNILKNKLISVFLGISLAMVLSGVIIAYFSIGNLSSPLIIHINDYTGVDMMGDSSYIWSLILIGIVFYLINLSLIKVFYMRERVISYIILMINFIVSLFILVNIGSIIALN